MPATTPLPAAGRRARAGRRRPPPTRTGGRFAGGRRGAEPRARRPRLLAELAEPRAHPGQPARRRAPALRRHLARHPVDRRRPPGRDGVALDELERLRTDLLSTIAHELRTPLTSVRTSVGLLLDPASQPTPDQTPDAARGDRAQRRPDAAPGRRHPGAVAIPGRAASRSSCGGSSATALARGRGRRHRADRRQGAGSGSSSRPPATASHRSTATGAASSRR